MSADLPEQNNSPVDDREPTKTSAAETTSSNVSQGSPSGDERVQEALSSEAEVVEEEAEAPAVLRRVGPSGEEVRTVTAAQQRGINRRELLKLVPLVALGAFAIPKVRQPLLDEGLRFSDWASGKLFGEHRLAQTFRNSQVARFEKFPYNYYDVLDPDVDFEKWMLTVEGLVQRPGDYTLQQIRALPKQVQNTRHVCVEGWDVIGNFGGVRGSDFLRFIGADTSARFLEVECVDDYYESIDMATMLHPQTLFCYEMYGQPLDRGHGAPLRLQMPTKLGYKQAKYLDTIRVTNVLKHGMRGYWEDQGYDWYGGL
jgi:DMSO/TMAO reductase YedYZ molybdopterin-dependent catalytic subunit